jgi:cytidylate kinase
MFMWTLEQCIAQSHFCDAKRYIAAEYFDKESLINSLPTTDSIQIQSELGFAEMYLNDTNVEKEIRTIEVSSFVKQSGYDNRSESKISGTAKGNGK